MKKTNKKNNKTTNKKTTKKQPRYGISHPDLFHHSRWHVHLNLWQVVSPVVHAPKFGVALVKGLHRRQKNLILKGRTPDVIDLNGGYQHQGRNVWQLKKITEGEFICQSWSFKNLQVAQFLISECNQATPFPYVISEALAEGLSSAKDSKKRSVSSAQITLNNDKKTNK